MEPNEITMWDPLQNVFHHQVKSQGDTHAKCMGARWFYNVSEFNGSIWGVPLAKCMKTMEVNPTVWGPLQQIDGTLCNPKGNPSKSCAKCETTIEVNPKVCPIANKWKPYEILGYPYATYLEIHWYLKDPLFFQSERRSNEIVSKGTLAKCMQTTKLVRRGVRCKMIGLASEIPMGIWWNPKGCPCKAYSGHPLIS